MLPSKSLFYKINSCLQRTTTCIGLQTEKIFSVDILHIYFSNFWRDLCGSFTIFSQKLQFLVLKKLEWFLLHCNSIFMSSKRVPQIFKILFETGDINVFALRFSTYVQLRNSFSDEKTSAVIYERHFHREAIKV